LGITPQDQQSIEAQAHFTAGLVEQFDRAPDSALDHFLAAVDRDPGNEELTLDVVAKLIARRRLQDARVLLERASKRPDASSSVWAWLGNVRTLQGDPQGALDASREAVRRNPIDIRPYQNLVQLHLETGQVQHALEIIDEAASQTSSDPAFYLTLVDLLRALEQTPDIDKDDLLPRWRPLLDKAAALNPEEPADVQRLAAQYLAIGETDLALPLFQRLLETHPDLPGLRETLTALYLQSDDRQRATEQLQALAQRQPTNFLPHYYLALMAMEDRRLEDALAAFQRVLILRPDDLPTHLRVALLHLNLRQPAEALAILEQVRGRFRASFETELYAGIALTELKRYDEAVRAFLGAEVIANATAPNSLTAEFYFQSGMAYERASRWEDAAVQFEKAIELKPDFSEALNYLGYMWAEKGAHLPRAEELIRRALEIEPDNAAYLDSLAWVLHMAGRSAEALPHQLRAVELIDQPDPVLFDHLGDIYHRLERLPEARDAWNRAFQLDPQPEIREKLDRLPTAP
jgi:tetratricopeptide (TPR) repeat protein